MLSNANRGGNRRRGFKSSKKGFKKMYKKYVKPQKQLAYVFPDRYMCKLRYASEFTLNPAVDGLTVCQTFRANSLYDPDATAVGHQPHGFDQLCLFYNHFTVVGSKIRVVPFTQNASIIPMLYGVALDATAGEVAGKLSEDILEQSNNTRARQAGVLNMVNTNFKGRSITFSLKKFFNTKDITDDKFQCSATSNPAEMAYYDVWACSMGATDAGALTYTAVIDYIVICHEPKRVTQS